MLRVSMDRLNGSVSTSVKCNELENYSSIEDMEPGLRVADFGLVGSRVSVSDPVFDPVLSFNMRIYRGVTGVVN